MKMKKLFFIFAAAVALILTACGGSGAGVMIGGFDSVSNEGGGGIFHGGDIPGVVPGNVPSGDGGGGGGTFGGGGGGGGGGTFGGGGGGSGGRGGTFTLTGIPAKYEGQYVYFIAVRFAGEFLIIEGLQTFSLSNMYAKVSNGRVTIPLWEITAATANGLPGYSGNDTCLAAGFFMIDPSLAPVDPMAFLMSMYGEDVFTFDSVTFRNGSATRDWKDRDNAYDW